MKDRKDIDKKYTWNLDVIYSNTTEFDKDYDLVIDKINSLKKELEKYDYIGVKIAMGVATKEEYAEQIAHTETLREQIRQLESEVE